MRILFFLLLSPLTTESKEQARFDDAGSGSGSGDGDSSGNFQESALDRIQRIKRSKTAHVAERGARYGAETGAKTSEYNSWPASIYANIPTRLSDSNPYQKQEERKEKKVVRYDQMNQIIAEYEDPDYEASGQEDATKDRGLTKFFALESSEKEQDTAFRREVSSQDVEDP